jgi:hypothetical protein
MELNFTLGFGGNTATDLLLTEFWDGTTWTEVADLATARIYKAELEQSYFCFSFWWCNSYLKQTQKNGQ